MISSFLEGFGVLSLIIIGIVESFLFWKTYRFQGFNSGNKDKKLLHQSLNFFLCIVLALSSLDSFGTLGDTEASSFFLYHGLILSICVTQLPLAAKLWTTLYNCLATKVLIEVKGNEVNLATEDTLKKGEFGWFYRNNSLFKRAGLTYGSVGYVIFVILVQVAIRFAGYQTYKPWQWIALVPIVPIFTFNFLVLLALVFRKLDNIDPLQSKSDSVFGGSATLGFVAFVVWLRYYSDPPGLLLGAIGICFLVASYLFIVHPLQHANELNSTAALFHSNQERPKNLLEYREEYGIRGSLCFLKFARHGESVFPLTCVERCCQYGSNAKAKKERDTRPQRGKLVVSGPLMAHSPTRNLRPTPPEPPVKSLEELFAEATLIMQLHIYKNAPFYVHLPDPLYTSLKSQYDLFAKDIESRREAVARENDVDASSASLSLLSPHHPSSDSHQNKNLTRTMNSEVYTNIQQQLPQLPQRENSWETLFYGVLEFLSPQISADSWSRYMVSAFRKTEKDGRLHIESSTHSSKTGSSFNSQSRDEKEDWAQETPLSASAPHQHKKSKHRKSTDIIESSPLDNKHGSLLPEDSEAEIDPTPVVDLESKPRGSSKKFPSGLPKSLSSSPRGLVSHQFPSPRSSSASSSSSSRASTSTSTSLYALRPPPSQHPSPTPSPSQPSASPHSPNYFFTFRNDGPFSSSSRQSGSTETSSVPTTCSSQQSSRYLSPPLSVVSGTISNSTSCSPLTDSSISITIASTSSGSPGTWASTSSGSPGTWGSNSGHPPPILETDEDQPVVTEEEPYHSGVGGPLDSDFRGEEESRQRHLDVSAKRVRRYLQIPKIKQINYHIQDIFTSTPEIVDAAREVGILKKSKKKIHARRKSLQEKRKQNEPSPGVLAEFEAYQKEFEVTKGNASEVVEKLHSHNQKMGVFVKEVEKLIPTLTAPYNEETMVTLKAACDRLSVDSS